MRQFPQHNSNDTQTDSNLTKCDVSEEKLKKIVSFFEKISDPDQILTEMKKSRFSMSNLQTETAGDGSDSTSDKRTVSLVNLNRKPERAKYSSGESTVTSKGMSITPITCHLCGEQFDYRLVEQLQLVSYGIYKPPYFLYNINFLGIVGENTLRCRSADVNLIHFVRHYCRPNFY